MPRKLTIADIFDTRRSPRLSGSTQTVKWAPDGIHLILRDAAETSAKPPRSVVAATGAESTVTLPAEGLSPNGQLKARVDGGNLFVDNLNTGAATALTTDGSTDVLNGRLDWVYQEEVYGRGNFTGFWWNPDSSRLAFLRIDDSAVVPYSIVHHISGRPETETTRYPRAGQPNPAVRLGVAMADGSGIVWMDLSSYSGLDHLIVRVSWASAARLCFQVQDREQTWLDLNAGDPDTGTTHTLFRETSPAWVSVLDVPRFLSDGSFLWLSERSGWRHVYHFEGGGALRRQVTAGAWEVRSILGVDEASSTVYFSGTEHASIANHTYRIALDGTGLMRLTRTEGNHTSEFNPSLDHFADTWSDLHTPPQIRLHRASDGDVVRVIETNDAAALSEFEMGSVDHVCVAARDGFPLEALLIRPPNFHPDRLYPVLCHVYGGPHAPRVVNAWGGANYLWHQLVASHGYLVWIFDNRSAGGKGFAPASAIYRNFGELELRDLEDGLAWLKAQPFVDASRIGIWGSSFGGYMTLYALTHSRAFRAGIAIAPVTHWELYDSIYTERYMASPQTNPDGYARASVLNSAADLQGRLLLIHGMADDNVHVEHSIRMADALQNAGKQFQFMLYPRRRHGAGDDAAEIHMRQLMLEFVLNQV